MNSKGKNKMTIVFQSKSKKSMSKQQDGEKNATYKKSEKGPHHTDPSL